MTRIVMLKTGSVLSKTKSYRKKLHHRPATFIQKMYASLQGWYREHILQDDLPDRMLQKCFNVKKGRLQDSEEKWAKKSMCDRKENKTKYFHTPEVIPSPKAKVGIMAINKILKPNIFFIIT